MRRLLHGMRRPAGKEYAKFAPQEREECRSSDGTLHQQSPMDPLGLTVLFEPIGALPSVDIVFVHGLRGRSMHTWSLDKDLEHFWPQNWLPTEPSIGTARISTFGYDSDYLAGGPKEISNVADFAKDLLFRLKFSLDSSGEGLHFGKVPVIFVVHSMGGLVVKKAYIIGTNNDKYEDIIQSTSAILFLSTPHRGSDLSELLNRILKLLLPGRSTKEYISELQRNSSTLEDINEQFRNLAPRLEIVSFYETVATVFSPYERMILDKDSSILGYPGELTVPLFANHRGVCKFSSRNDPNYIKVRDILRDLVTRLGTWSLRSQQPRSSKKLHFVRALLAVTQAPEEDYEFFRQKQTLGTCDWIFSQPAFKSWLEDRSQKPRVIWFHGAPGTGKSVFASYAIEVIRKEHSSSCQYFYFRYNDQDKTTANSFLRSLAYQIACHVPEFEQRLAVFGEAGSIFEKASDLFIWRKLFVDILFGLRLTRPIYWVIDGFDECTSPWPLLSHFLALPKSDCPIRIMIVSRWTQKLFTGFQKLASAVRLDTHQIQATEEDLTRFVQIEIQDPDIPGDNNVKQRIASKLIERTEGNFLWTRLVLEELRDCRTEKNMTEVLASLSPDLELLYQRMNANLMMNWKSGDEKLAKAVLMWAACSRFPLTLQAICGALGSRVSMILDFQGTIGLVCGNFIEIDSESRITIVHHTARDYLTRSPNHKLYINTSDAHREIFKTCLSVLSNPTLRSREAQVELGPFLQYAAMYWPYHLVSCASNSDDEMLSLLAGFLDSTSVLNWISILSYALQLKQLVLASKALSRFLAKTNELDSERSPLLHNLKAKRSLELMAVELLKVLAKFGADLLRYPDAIHNLIPPFCPADSLIRRRFASVGKASMTVEGISNSGWDESLVKFPVERDHEARNISCKDQYFAISTSSPSGTIRVFYTLSCGEAQSFSHGERVQSLQLSNSGKLLATYGYLTTKIWDIAAARLLYKFDNPRGTRLLAMSFLADDEAILTCSDDRLIRKFLLIDPPQAFETLDSVLTGDGSPDGKHFKAPSCAAFSPLGTLLAVAYPGCPLSVWNILESRLIDRYNAFEDENGHISQADIVQVCWSPTSEHVLGTYNDGHLFKCQLLGGEPIQVLAADARSVVCSPTGSFVVTSDSYGTLKIRSFEDLSLIYQLSCPTFVSDLAVNPDGKRVYDLRGPYCNIWEPNSLIRLAEPDEKVIDTASASASSARVSHISESSAKIPEPIEALAVGGRTSVYCTGHADGAVKIFDGYGNKLQDLNPNSMAIDQVTWSEDERYLAVADIGTRVYVKQFSNDFSPLGNVLEETLGESIQQLLFNKPASILLAITEGSLIAFSLDGESFRIRKTLPSMQQRWINHPSSDDLLIGLGPENICILRWHGLKMYCDVSMNSSTTALRLQAVDVVMPVDVSTGHLSASTIKPLLSTTSVKKVLISGCRSCILLQLSKADQSIMEKEVRLIYTGDLDALGPMDKRTITAISLPKSFQDHIDRPFGFIGPEFATPSPGNQGLDTGSPQDQLTFLSKNGWICTVPLNHAVQEARVKRHFFLPQDWLNVENLELAHTTREGTLFCPKDGEVGLIRNGFKNELSFDC